MKKVILVLLLASSSLMQAMEMTNLKEGLKSKSTSEEKFEFEQLPGDMQNEIIETAWSNADTKENLEKQIFDLKVDASSGKKTTSSEDNIYGFKGDKKPIYYNTLDENGNPCIKIVGNILNLAQKVYYIGIWVSWKSISTQLFIHGPDNKIYSTTLEDPQSIPYVSSACFSVLGDVAILWKEIPTDSEFCSIIKLKDIQENKTIDLRKNVHKPLPDSKINIFKGSIPISLKNCLFSLGGRKLGIGEIKIDPTNPTNILVSFLSQEVRKKPDFIFYLDVPHNKQLTPGEKAKRLNIPTVASKKLIKKKSNSNNQKTSSHRRLYTAAGLGLGIGALLGGLAWYYYKK